MSITVKGLKLLHTKLGRDADKHRAIMERATDKLETAVAVYQERTKLAEYDYRRAVEIAAERREIALLDAQAQYDGQVKKQDAVYAKAHANHRTLNSVHKRLGAALADYDNRGEALSTNSQ